MKFYEVLRNLIDDNDLTQKRLADELNITPSTLGGYVQGTREPDFETLKLLAGYFGVTADYLLGLRPGPASTREESELLRVFRSLPNEQKQLFIEQGKTLLRFSAKEAAKSS
ncbi:MAG: helix-turn-helix domain-containing protein [Oscillospiraceae bacterium]|nr:helix-turn-helix domain-containing protein [Oscillospiraceae bacterium]